MTYPKLKPCPECAAETFLFGYEGWNGGISSWRVECDDCNYIGSCEGRKLDAIRVHNIRACDSVGTATAAEMVKVACRAYNAVLLNQPEDNRDQPAAMRAALNAISEGVGGE